MPKNGPSLDTRYTMNVHKTLRSCDGLEIWNFSGPDFPVFGMNMEIYGVHISQHPQGKWILTGYLFTCPLKNQRLFEVLKGH